MIEVIKVWWHCLTNSHKNIKEEHRMCTYQETVNGVEGSVHHMCSCGYNDPDRYLKKFEEELAKMRRELDEQ